MKKFAFQDGGTSKRHVWARHEREVGTQITPESTAEEKDDIFSPPAQRRNQPTKRAPPPPPLPPPPPSNSHSASPAPEKHYFSLSTQLRPVPLGTINLCNFTSHTALQKKAEGTRRWRKKKSPSYTFFPQPFLKKMC